MQEFSLDIIASAKILRDSLHPLYSQREADSLSKLLVEFVTQKRYIDFLVQSGNSFSPSQLETFTVFAHRLLSGEPIQYILRSAPFYGYEFKVRPGVLIPRGETESLVDWIIQTHPASKKLSVLDIGTGSGCIGVTLSKECPHWQVTACDVSEVALEIARENALSLEAALDFKQLDILQWKPDQFHSLDLIVSNPPYITEAERSQMHGNVLDHEPSLALFVPDATPLVYYKAIAQAGKEWLRNGGHLYFEINEGFGPEVCQLLEAEGYSEVILKQDLHSRDRMVRGLWAEIEV